MVPPTIDITSEGSQMASCSRTSSAPTLISPSATIENFITQIDNANNDVNMPSSTATNDPTNDCALRIVPPPFAVFLSRLEYGTKPSAILNYIAKKGIDTISIRCLSLTADNLPGRISASFKLLAPSSTGKILLNPDFWPRDILVKEFTNRHNAKSSSSKNSKKLPSSTRT